MGAYLDSVGIIALAREKGVLFIHPGSGFLSENADFAQACADAGITFVGPRPEVLRLMGDKTAARALVQALEEESGLPIHFHTHDTRGIAAASGLEAAEVGVDLADLAIASLSGSTSQPCLNSIVAALRGQPRDTGLTWTRLTSSRTTGSWCASSTPPSTPPPNPAAPTSISTKCPAASTPTSRNKSPP